jgi:cyclopropane fatty-acyl-phospholipid synthase-like methyltransferase
LSKPGARAYVDSRSGLDGLGLVLKLRLHLPAGSNLLELGIGSGADLILLNKYFEVTGSDYSRQFLELFAEKQPNIPLLEIDAVTIDTTDHFDCIFSNKVLHHLSEPELKESLCRQCEIVRDEGILFHSFWLGTEKRFADHLHFNRYSENEIVDLFEPFGSIIDQGRYSELNKDDSYYIAVQK